MVKISHFKHDHPLITLKQAPKWLSNDERSIACYGCHKPLPWAEEDGEDVIACATCKTLFLHESCVEFPKEICHSLYERHSFLLRVTPDPNQDTNCLACGDSTKKGPFYEYQFDVAFGLHIKCAFKEKESVVAIDNDLTLVHPSHKHHTLRLQPRPASFNCDAFCEFNDKDFYYQCSSCTFWIHRRCALLPSTTDWPVGHPHPLSLSFGLPSQYQKSFAFHCNLCRKHINSTDKAPRWLYYCNLCRYFAHISCMAQFQHKDRNRLHIHDFSPRLPARYNSPELIQSFVATVNKNNSSSSAVQSKIQMFSHKHPLTLSHKQILENDTEDDEELLCDACIDPIIYPPYYHCAKCRYFLHLHCANLPSYIEPVKYYNYKFRSSYYILHWENMPRILEKGSHPHPLILGSTTRFYDNFRCNLCNKFSNGFYYSCEVEECRFHTDLKCAVLPSIMKHESHKHRHDVLLLLKGKNYTKPCGACNINVDKGSTNFECESCEFYLHERCALLPQTVRHDFDIKHPLTLRYPPHYYHPDPFDCAQCEKEIHPLYWLYHCEECDLSFHVYCVNRAGEFGNHKCGQKLQIDIHPHALKFVRKASVNTPCHRCQVDINKDLAFECETCNFHLCRPCVQTIQP